MSSRLNRAGYILLFRQGTTGPNRFGSDPLAPTRR